MRVNIYDYDPATNEAVYVGFAPTGRQAIMLVLPGLPPEVFEREDVEEGLRFVDQGTRAIYISKREEGKPIRFNASLGGLRREYGIRSQDPFA